MNLRRVFILLMSLTGCFAWMIVRLMMIQLWSGDRYSSRGIDLTAAAVYQREQGVLLDDGRGRFVDRTGKPLTGFTITALAVDTRSAKSWAEERAEDLRRLLGILGMSSDEWERIVRESGRMTLWRRDGIPVALTDDQIAALEPYAAFGLRAVPYVMRYRQPCIASHLLGYISQHPERLMQLYADELAQGAVRPDQPIGASGLERAFERLVRGRGGMTLSLFTDALGRPLRGLDARVLDLNPPFYPLRVVTTIDLELQEKVEQLLDRKGVKEASVVLLDPDTADVLVMANRPNYDPRRPRPESREWVNEAIKQQVPGSIFKIVVAAAALEYGVVRPNERFVCRGEYGKYGFSCWNRHGHGEIAWRDALAQSCNITFAETALRLTPEQIEDTARRLGIGRRVGWEQAGKGEVFRQFDLEESGQVFAPDSRSNPRDEGVMIQTAIGQRDVRMTPLQAANMVVTLLNGGRLTAPRVVSEVTYRDGSVKQRYPVRRQERAAISKETADMLLAMMNETVRSGTASSLRDHAWRLAGKTGTAQLAKGDLVHEWFVGYGPVGKPKFVACVVVYNVRPGGKHMATELFKDIADLVRNAQEHRGG